MFTMYSGVLTHNPIAKVSGKFRDKFTGIPLGRKRVDCHAAAGDATSVARSLGQNCRHAHSLGFDPHIPWVTGSSLWGIFKDSGWLVGWLLACLLHVYSFWAFAGWSRSRNGFGKYFTDTEGLSICQGAVRKKSEPMAFCQANTTHGIFG